MITIKKLIIREWLWAFMASLFVLILLVTIANVVSELLRGVTTLPDILTHHFLELPKWLNNVIPVSCLTAGLFSINKLQRRNELMAIFISGFSQRAYLTLIFYLSLGVASIQFYMVSYVRPYAQSLRKDWLRDGGIHFRSNKAKGIRINTLASGKIWYKNDKYISSFEAFDKLNNELKMATYYYYNYNKISEIIKAQRVKYIEGYKWKLIDGEKLQKLNGRSFPERTPFKEDSITLLEKPLDFSAVESNILELSIVNLYRFIQKIKRLSMKTNEYETILFDKIASSIICIIFSLVSIQAIFYPNRRHSSFGKIILIVLVFSILFWLSHSSLLALGSNDKISPFWSTFSVPLICIFFLLFYFFKHRRLS